MFGIASLQEAFATRNIDQSFPATASQDHRYTWYNPHLGLRYDVNADEQIFMNLSRSFEPPTWVKAAGAIIRVRGGHFMRA
ncbi:MAG: TonB-dependent receptor [Micavibrio sp.]|nr:TonB-dependent receptor [Micavibrio sp.]